jgi:hypothetical protein
MSAFELLVLTMHETYPGHHVERCSKEQLLVRGRGLLEETIVLVPTPQSLVSRGGRRHGDARVRNLNAVMQATLVVVQHERRPGAYMRNTPNVVSGTGAFAAAARPSASTRRVSRGSMIPSSHSRAVE